MGPSSYTPSDACLYEAVQKVELRRSPQARFFFLSFFPRVIGGHDFHFPVNVAKNIRHCRLRNGIVKKRASYVQQLHVKPQCSTLKKTHRSTTAPFLPQQATKQFFLQSA